MDGGREREGESVRSNSHKSVQRGSCCRTEASPQRKGVGNEEPDPTLAGGAGLGQAQFAGGVLTLLEGVFF